MQLNKVFVVYLQVNLETLILRSWLIALMCQSFDLYLIRSELFLHILKLFLLIVTLLCFGYLLRSVVPRLKIDNSQCLHYMLGIASLAQKYHNFIIKAFSNCAYFKLIMTVNICFLLVGGF